MLQSHEYIPINHVNFRIMKSRSYLILEIGTLNTRAGYFEEVGSRLRLIQTTTEPSTQLDVERDVMKGVLNAIKTLEKKIDKRLLAGTDLITPEDENGQGVDSVEAIYSFGSPISTLVVDLAKKDNTEVIRNIAARNNIRIVDSVSEKYLLDSAFMLRVVEDSAIELILLWVDSSSDAGKIEKLVELFLISHDVFGKENSPSLIVIGDQRKIRQGLKGLSREHSQKAASVPVRSIAETGAIEEIDDKLVELIEYRRSKLIPSMGDLKQFVHKNISFSDRYNKALVAEFGAREENKRNIVHIDIGASSILLTGWINGKLIQEKAEYLGIGSQFINALSVVKMPNLMRRTNFPSEEKIRNYVFQRSLNPDYIPDRQEELTIHYELVRNNLRVAFEKFYTNNFPSKTKNKHDLAIDDVYLSGEVFTNAPQFQYLARLVLEGIKIPSSACVYIDRYNSAAMIGKLISNDPLKFEQLDLKGCILPSFLSIPARSSEHDGDLIGKIMVTEANGVEKVSDIIKGDLLRLDIQEPAGVKIVVQPIGHTDVGKGKGARDEHTLPDGFNMIIVDARERPISLPAEIEERRNVIVRWQMALGGSE